MKIQTARRYAAFWNTGDEAYAKQALSPAFIDRTLPDGRIVENRHLEDNLTLLKQLGAVKP
ncbi:ester cyclase [Paraburkholderia sp. BCC1884]|uniref:ester cyclase n=1 Tax=Paraburkholderia sp. BCC1884 TaxID=2562668 RepID=UPI0011839C77|nr:ester cyclase [Paraburkholderia sp. BCC1884]